MNTKVIALLKSRNPADRKQGVMLAGRSGETDYIRVLQKLASIEPDPYLKTLEEKTVHDTKNHVLRKILENPPRPVLKQLIRILLSKF